VGSKRKGPLVAFVLAPSFAVLGAFTACSSDDGPLAVEPRTTNPVALDATDEDVGAADANDEGGDAGLDAPSASDADAGAVQGAIAIATGAGPSEGPAIGYGDHTCAIAGPERSVYCWGANEHGQAGNGQLLDAGADADAALDDGGLYDGGASPADVPEAVRLATDEQGLAFSGADEIAAAAWHSCARRANDLYCWGQRFTGAQAEPPFAGNPDRTKPRFIGHAPIARVAAGGPHTCVLLATGKLACFGHSSFGELGRSPAGDPACAAPFFYDYAGLAPGAHTCDGEIAETTTPIAGVQGLVAGEVHTCAIALTHVKCWGSNALGQLGAPGAAAPQPAPVEVLVDPATSTPLDGVSALAGSGGEHACALSNGSVFCWGSNASGELGVDPATTPSRAQAAAVTGLPPITGVGAGDGVSCALTGDGYAYCWGADDAGQLGDGAPKPSSPAPVRVKGPANVGLLGSVQAIAPGRRHVCALLADHTVWCWGKNDRGQLGDGTFVDSLYPVKVKGLPE
jgi:alpha-tubulin suppressor-like RCC1 family protein